MFKLDLTALEAGLLIKTSLYGLKGPRPVEPKSPAAKVLETKLLELYKLVAYPAINRHGNVAPRASSSETEAFASAPAHGLLRKALKAADAYVPEHPGCA